MGQKLKTLVGIAFTMGVSAALIGTAQAAEKAAFVYLGALLHKGLKG